MPVVDEQEIDFVMSDLSLEIIGDFAIVWLLSPKKTFTAAPTSALGLAISKLPGHALQVRSWLNDVALPPSTCLPLFA